MLDASARISSASTTTGTAHVGASHAARAPSAPTGSEDFSDVLSHAVANVAQQLRQAEAVSMANMKGFASTQDVVEQVMMAEQTLQAAIAVRDKIVAAYLEISRMQV